MMRFSIFQRVLQVLAIQSAGNKRSGIESGIDILAIRHKVIGFIDERAHIACGHIQQVVVVAGSIREATCMDWSLFDEHDAQIVRLTGAKNVDRGKCAAEPSPYDCDRAFF